MGYSIVIAMGNHLQMIEMNVLRLRAGDDNYKRLQLIHQRITELIKEHHPDCFAIEAPFFGKNVQSMLKLGRAQGVAIAAAIGAGLPVCEYSPKKIKQSITGNGNAGKEQVWKMLQQILLLEETALPSMDASDALAVAVCHHFQQRPGIPSTNPKASGWRDFIAKNPGRII